MPHLAELVAARDRRIAHRAISLVRERGLSTYAPPLEQEWRAAARTLSEAMAAAWRSRIEVRVAALPAAGGGGDDTPAQAFGVAEARRHRAHGLTLPGLLGLLKAWRQACLELAEEGEGNAREFALAFFDAAEIGAADEWTAPGAGARERELSAASRKLALENGRLTALFASLPNPVLLVEPDGFLAARNQAALRLFPPPAGEDPGLAPPWLLRRLGPVLAGAAPEIAFEEELKLPEGKRRFAIGAEPVRDVTQRFAGAAVWLEDVTEARRLEVRLRAAERLASVGALAAGVAHELASPLASVQSGLSFLSAELDELGSALPPDRAAELVETVSDARQATARVTRIVRAMQALSGRGAGELEPVLVAPPLRAAVEAVATRLQGRARLEVELRDLPPVWGSGELLGQVFQQLLVHAAGALAQGDPARDLLRVEACAAGEEVTVRIADTGPGLPPQVLRRAFDPFFTTRPVGQGAGLGLAMCQAAVAAFGGSVALEPGAAGGTVAVLTLRAVLDPAPGERRAAAAGA